MIDIYNMKTEDDYANLKSINKNLSKEEKLYVRGRLLCLFGYERKIVEFKEKLMTCTMDKISITDLPFADVESYESIAKLGLKTFYDICHYDLNELQSKVSKSTFDDILRFADTADIYIEAGIIEGC